MGFCYDTTRISVRTEQQSSAFDPLRCDANRCYMEHYRNLLTLQHFATYGTMKERAQANAEIEICERKLKYWERQPHFESQLAIEAKNNLHKRIAS